MTDIYEKLRARLDDMATGYPATESKVEIRLLKRLFSEEEAQLYMELSPLLQNPADVAARLKRDPDQLSALMEQMAQKGLLFRQRKGDLVRYAPVPYVVGIFEHQLKRMDPEFARDHEEYFETAFGRTIQEFQTPVLRTIPISRQVVAQYPVAPYEDVLKIIDDQKKIAVAPCVCRMTAKLAGKGCDKPMEACFTFGSHADYYVENYMGRYITHAEAKEIIKKNEEAGLVMQPFNSQKIGGMCSCCGDCCGVLRSLKMRDEKPVGALTFTVGAQEYFIPVNESIDVEAEIAKLEEELKYTRGFLASVSKKLSNERFVNNAPAAVVDKEKKKATDAEARIKVIEEQLKDLKFKS